MNKNSSSSGIDEHLTINAMLFSHLDKSKKELLSLDDISKSIREIDFEKLILSKNDWQELTSRFKDADLKNCGKLDF